MGAWVGGVGGTPSPIKGGEVAQPQLKKLLAGHRFSIGIRPGEETAGKAKPAPLAEITIVKHHDFKKMEPKKIGEYLQSLKAALSQAKEMHDDKLVKKYEKEIGAVEKFLEGSIAKGPLLSRFSSILKRTLSIGGREPQLAGDERVQNLRNQIHDITQGRPVSILFEKGIIKSETKKFPLSRDIGVKEENVASVKTLLKSLEDLSKDPTLSDSDKQILQSDLADLVDSAWFSGVIQHHSESSVTFAVKGGLPFEK